MGACHAMHRGTQHRAPGRRRLAVDTALWDLEARLLGIRLARLVGIVHDGVPVYGSGGFISYDKPMLTQQLECWVQQLQISS